MLLRGTPVIINDVDCPEAKLVAVIRGYDAKRGVWKADYLSTRTNMARCWASGEIGRPTPISEFGMKVELDEAGLLFRVIPSGQEPTAKYRDGKPRNWQDRNSSEHRWWPTRKAAVRLLNEANN